MSVETQKETMEFQAEVRQLMKLMIHSLYSNKEIFLRELISNASDACDKLRFEALSSEELYDGDSDLKIRINFDKDARTITVSDNGIGMSREEVVENIGTIAKSGTKQFFESLTGEKSHDLELIGQFGVGFYSSFMVADEVEVALHHNAVLRSHFHPDRNAVAGRRQGKRVRGYQQCFSAVEASEEGDQRRGIQGILQARGTRLR